MTLHSAASPIILTFSRREKELRLPSGEGWGEGDHT
jgi:hypothetical protein